MRVISIPGMPRKWNVSAKAKHARRTVGCKVSLATNLHPAKGGRFLLHAQALHGNPYDGHTLAAALEDIRKTVGRVPQRVAVDEDSRGIASRCHTRRCTSPDNDAA